jgi:crotonobetaine/carnitine-CoA ligase
MTEVVSEGIVGDSTMPPANGSMGRPAVEYDVVLVDDEDRPVEPGKAGHLLIRAQRGIGLFLEYYKDPEATSRAFTPDGFFRTGDIVMRLPDGSLRYWDRFKDMLKVGGENVAASEIERVIGQVEGVVEVAVVAKPHEFLSEVPAAFVLVARELEAPHADRLIASVIAACERELADFKRPREVRIVLELPRGVNGKILKRELRQLLIAATES